MSVLQRYLLVIAIIWSTWLLRAGEPPQGSPLCLLDRRWLAQPPVGKTFVISADPTLKKDGNAFLLLDAKGPGVLLHLWTMDGSARFTLVVDQKKLWQGKLSQPSAIFPEPLISARAFMCHLLAPVGFKHTLRILGDKPRIRYYIAYRSLPEGTEVMPATHSDYSTQLGKLRQVWAKYGWEWKPLAVEKTIRKEFVLLPLSSVETLFIPGSGTVVRLEFNLTPPLQGSSREIIVEFFYDGTRYPSLRLPIADVVGVPYSWPLGRWNTYNGSLAGGIRYPRPLSRPRHYFRELSFHFNPPVTFEKGLRIRLKNRLPSVKFSGWLRADIAPLPGDAGRLCARRAPATVASDLKPLIRIPGPGNLVALALYLTGFPAYPPAVRKYMLSLKLDRKSISGLGVLPLRFHGRYGGVASLGTIWNHPRHEDNFAGVTRYFLTDPLYFQSEAVLSFSPGDEKRASSRGALAFWYRFGDEPYTADPLAERPEPLPYSKYGSRPPEARVRWKVFPSIPRHRG